MYRGSGSCCSSPRLCLPDGGKSVGSGVQRPLLSPCSGGVGPKASFPVWGEGRHIASNHQAANGICAKGACTGCGARAAGPTTPQHSHSGPMEVASVSSFPNPKCLLLAHPRGDLGTPVWRPWSPCPARLCRHCGGGGDQGCYCYLENTCLL